MKRRVRSLPLIIFLGLPLSPGLQQSASAQVSGANVFLTEGVTLDLEVAPETVLKPGEDLGTLLAERIRVSSTADGRPIQLGLWVEAYSQKEGSLGRFDTFSMHFEPGRVDPGKAWIQDPAKMNKLAAPGFGDRRKEEIVLNRVVVINHEEQYVVINHEEQYLREGSPESKQAIVFPDVCKDSPYALVIGVSAPELNGSPSAPKCVVCLAE